MKKPFAISLGFHAAILLAALVVLPAPKPFEVKPQEAIQVDISNISDKTQQMATAKDATPAVEKPAPKETMVVKDVPPAPKVDDKINNAVNVPKDPPPAPPPKPEPPKPKEDPVPPEPTDLPIPKAPPPKPKPVDTAALDSLLKKVDEPKKPVEKKKPELKLDEIAALLNKDKGEHTAPQKPAKEAGAPKLAAKDNTGNDAAMTATIIDALTSKVKSCFEIPAAARDANISVRIHFKLNPDGSVNGQPEVASMSSDPIFDATARAAISAIVECQNYDLPKEQYSLWQDNVLDFNPNLFFG